MRKAREQWPIWLLLLGISLLYILFPTHNSTIDAYGFAAAVKYGEDLLHPHHLLYNLQGYFIYQVYSAIFGHADPLAFLTALNGFYGFLMLVVILLILKQMGVQSTKQLLLLMLAAFSFGVWRFATENEAYLLPILVSLAGSYFWVRGVKTDRWSWYLVSGVFASLACLFHQIQVFWWIGLCVGCLFMKWPKALKRTMVFSAPAIMIPVAYLLAIQSLGFHLSMRNILHYVFYEYVEGNATSTVGLKNILLTPISLFRSFFQVHGYLFKMLSQNWVFWILAILSLLLAIAGIVILLRNKWHLRSQFTGMAKVHLLIALLILVFAFFSVGNAEFMAAVPVLAVVTMGCFSRLRSVGLAALGISLLLWNFTFGIWPLYHYQMQADEMIAGAMQRDPSAVYILEDPVRPANILYYKNHLSIHEVQRCERMDPLKIQELLKGAKMEGRMVFSNCGGQPQVMNRAAIMSEAETDNLLIGFQKTVIDSAESYNGWHFLYELQLWQKE